jgi:hypothetical protein
LIKRNEKRQREQGENMNFEQGVQLPFIVINADKDAAIDCQMEKDRCVWATSRQRKRE